METGDGPNILPVTSSQIHAGTYVICPTCKGRGYCDESENKERHLDGYGNGYVTLPKIIHHEFTQHKTMNRDKYECKLPILQYPKGSSPLHSPKTSEGDVRDRWSDNTDLFYDFIGEKEVENSNELAKIVKAQLNSTNWIDRSSGLMSAVHLHRREPELAAQMGRLIARVLITELGSLRSRCVRTACQAARELFKYGGFIYRPEFDELATSLLCRTTDSKKSVREDACDALSVIANQCPVQHVARAIVKGPLHKHQSVRRNALKMIKTVVSRIGVRTLFRSINYRDVRSKIVESACTLLEDPISEIRSAARELLKSFIMVQEFDEVLELDVDHKILKRIQKSLFNLRYETREFPQYSECREN